MSEADVVMAIEWGTDETEVCAQHGLTFEKLDEIMEAHSRKRCAGCGSWWFRDEIPDEHCPECREADDDV